MAAGFWQKFVDFAKKVWGGVQKGADIAKKYVIPIIKHTTSLLSKSDNKDVAQIATDVDEGLGKISPLIKKLSGGANRNKRN